MVRERQLAVPKGVRSNAPDLSFDEHHLVRPFCSIRRGCTGASHLKQTTGSTWFKSMIDAAYVSIKLDVDFSLQVKKRTPFVC
jgi:hypothetical protein